MVFAAGGSTVQTLTLTGLDDSGIEYDEFVTLRLLSNQSGVTNGAVTNFHVGVVDADIPAALAPGDLAVIGRKYDGNNDSFSLLTLASIPAGSVIYLTDNGWTGSGFRNTTANDGAGNEDLMKLVIHSALTPGLILRSTDTSDSRWTWVTSGSIPFGPSGSFSTMALPDGGDEQISLFQAGSSNPLANVTGHIFLLDDSGGFEAATDSSTGAEPTGISSNSDTALSFDLAAHALIGLNMARAGTNSFSVKADWLNFINDVANWTTTGTVIPYGGVNIGTTCDGGRAPILPAPGDKTATAGSAFSFTFLANDPTCTGPTLSATGLPAGAAFTYTPYGSNSLGTFSWTPAVNATGTYVVRFIATDSQPLSTSLNVRIYVRGSGEATNAAGVPASQTNWAVSITNLALGLNGGSVTVQWNSVQGITYDIYRSYNGFGSGMSWTKVTAGLEADGSEESMLSGAGSTQQFYQVVPTGFSPTSNGVWGFIRPAVKGNAFTMLAPPLVGSRALNGSGSFGARLAAVLSGNDDGVNGPLGDELFFFDANGQWVNLYLSSAGEWRDSGGALATNVLTTGLGVLLQRTSGTPLTPMFVGAVGNNGQSDATLGVGWNIVSFSEGKPVTLSSAFSNIQGGGSLNANWDEASADQLIVLGADGSWIRYQRMGDNTWYDLRTLTPANPTLLPGQAYYFLRQSTGGSLTVRY